MTRRMEPYRYEQRRFAKDALGNLTLPPHPLPSDRRTWTGWSAFIPDTPGAVKKKGDAVKISFGADYLEAPGGTIIVAGYSDLEKIVKALRP